MISICLLIIIIILIYILFQKEYKIKKIYKQVNVILFEQKELYVQQYHEGTLSLLESEIVKLVNRLYEQNHLLENDKVLLKQSLEDISHQIKTPLTSLNLIQESLKTCHDLEKKKLLKEQQLLLEKIEWLVASLLKIAQLDGETVVLKKEDTSFHSLIDQLIHRFEIQIELKNIYVNMNISKDNIHNIDILWTLEALSNILKNCIEHIPMNGIIEITTHTNPLYQEIIIQDNGEGISQEDLIHLFERFYKGKNSKSQSVGIGLALSRMIIEKQNGTITVENTYPGAKFTIHLYKEVI